MEIVKVKEYKTEGGRILVPGVEFSVVGERGRFRFMAHCLNELGQEWIDCYGGSGWRDAKGVMSFRSFEPERIKRVHWKGKMR